MALLVVPMRWATASCVRPARARAAMSSLTTWYSTQSVVGLLEAAATARAGEELLVVVDDGLVLEFSHVGSP
jgi:hypothetical protein